MRVKILGTFPVENKKLQAQAAKPKGDEAADGKNKKNDDFTEDFNLGGGSLQEKRMRVLQFKDKASSKEGKHIRQKFFAKIDAIKNKRRDFQMDHSGTAHPDIEYLESCFITQSHEQTTPRNELVIAGNLNMPEGFIRKNMDIAAYFRNY